MFLLKYANAETICSWQKLRTSDFEKERKAHENALSDLTTRERDIRNQLEDILHPQAVNAPKLIFQTLNGCKPLDNNLKKGKKKAATASAV